MRNSSRMIKAIILSIITLCFANMSDIAAAADAASGADDAAGGLERVEELLYGSPSTGGLLLRLSKVERDLYGMELPGSLSERLQALQIFVMDGNASQPSLLFKMAVAEWVTLRRVNSSTAFSDRVGELENILEGERREGALSPRLEGIITKILPDGVSGTSVQIPASTVFKAAFVEPVSVRSVAVGDTIALEIAEECVIDGTLASAKGNRLIAEVSKVSLPRSYGRPSEIQFQYKYIESLGGKRIPVIVGEESKKAMDVDSGVVGAAGASLAGVIAFGPLGLLGGFLVRGNDKQIPAGTPIYVETEDFATVDGYIASNIADLMNNSSADTNTSDAPASTEQTLRETVVY